MKPDTPVEPWGPEATAFTKQFLSGGTVRLELGPERVDRYGRFLAYVYVGEEMLNEQLIRAGLGRATRYPDSARYRKRFNAAEKEAKEKGLGVWSADSVE